MASHRNTLVRPQCLTQFPWSDLLLTEVCSDMHAVFSSLPGVCAARFRSVSMISLLESLSQQPPWMSARHAASDSHRCLVRLPVAFVTGVGVSFDSSFSLHSLAMCSTCLLFDFHSDPYRLHLILLHELRFPVISPPYHVGLIRGMICGVRMCHPDASGPIRLCIAAT